MKTYWTERLPGEVYERLKECRTRKSDIETLVNAKWNHMVDNGKKEQGYVKEDALISILELL